MKRLPLGLAIAVGAALAMAMIGGPRSARAAEYYVDGSNPAASAAGPGTPTAPYSTISSALAAHHMAGTTISVMPGAYPEQVTVPSSGLPGSPIVLRALAQPGQPVVVDGSDDFSNPSLWAPSSGDVWLAASVVWSPRQVFADDQRLAPSTLTPDALPARSFVYVAGSGLYVNAGGGNPGDHHARVGKRPYGFYVSARTDVVIDGFEVARAEDRCIQLTNGSSRVEVTGSHVHLAGRFGIQASGCSAIHLAGNVISDNADHGISLIAGTTGSTIERNESFRNALPTAREANGIYMFNAPGNLIRWNRFHDNQDTGEHMQSGSNGNISQENISWNNGDHGYDHLLATNNVHVGDVAYGNHMDGFSFEGYASGNQLFDCIATDNGLTTREFDLWVDANSLVGFSSNDNVFWNSNGQAAVKAGTTIYATVRDYSAATRQDSRTIEADPRFTNPAGGDFHLLAGSPAIDNANSSVANWPAVDAEGHARVDDPLMPNRGIGPVPYADRGALEYPVGLVGNQAPVASLQMSPGAGYEALPVTADASGSYDPDGSIASYQFDFGDGTVVGPQTSPTATHTYAAGRWTASVVVRDATGAPGSATISVPVASTAGGPNLIGNASFETDNQGWAAYGGAILQRVPGGVEGSYALEMAAPSGSRQSFGIVDQPGWVTATPAANVAYRVCAFVRSTSGQGRCTIQLTEQRSRRRKPWTKLSAPVTLSPTWQLVTLDYVTHEQGSPLSLTVSDQPAASGESFRVDALSMRQLSGAALTAALAAAAQDPGGESAGEADPAATDATTAGAMTSGIALGVSPNPLRGAGRLALALSQPGAVNIAIYDVNGREVRRMRDAGPPAAGVHVVPLDGRGDDGAPLRSGVYFYRVNAIGGTSSGRFVVMK